MPDISLSGIIVLQLDLLDKLVKLFIGLELSFNASYRHINLLHNSFNIKTFILKNVGRCVLKRFNRFKKRLLSNKNRTRIFSLFKLLSNALLGILKAFDI